MYVYYYFALTPNYSRLLHLQIRYLINNKIDCTKKYKCYSIFLPTACDKILYFLYSPVDKFIVFAPVYRIILIK